MGEIRVQKIKGEDNLADALTTHLEGNKLKQHILWVGINISHSRHDIMPTVGDTREESEETLSESDQD